MRFDRRDFLKIIGVGTTATAVSGCNLRGISTAIQLADEQVRPEPGPESWTASLCGLCSGGCGILVRKIGERVVKAEGNPISPVNRGGLCPIGQASLQLLYNPDRLRAPLKRVGERGSGRWEKIDWREAMAFIASKLKELRDKGMPHTLAVISGKGSELTDRLTRRLLDAYGSPNFISAEKDGPVSSVQHLTQGMGGKIAYDFENANYILSFGAPLVEGWMSPVRQMHALAYLRQGRPGQRGKLVQVESRLSATAAKADEWIPVRPGTEGVLALGIARVLIEKELYDRAFAEQHLLGFEDWSDSSGNKQSGFKTLVLEHYPPQKVSQITGVSLEVIERLAREFARYGPSLAIPGDGLAQYGNCNFPALAVHALNALVGNIDKPGGVLVREEPPLSPWPPVKQDQAAAAGLRQTALPSSDTGRLSQAILAEMPYKINALFIIGSNPLFSAPGSFRQALRKVPFVVSFSLFLDETAEEADLVLPDCTGLERWDITTGIPGFAVTTVAVGQPALPPLYESRPATEVILDLARALGGNIAASFPWKSSMEAIQALVMGLHRARRGMIFAGEFKQEHLDHRMRELEWYPTRDYPSFEAFWKDLVEKGGWMDPYYKYGDYQRALQSPSGKFELPPLLAEKPTHNTGDEGYPFYLYLFKPLALASEVSANLPFLQEIVGSSVHSAWDSWMEINPKSAKELGIKDRDWVVVESPAGKIKVRARLFPGAMPEVVNIPVGQGHTALGRWAKGRGVNPIALVDGRGPTKVRIYKA